MRAYDMHFTARHQQVAKPVVAAVNGICAGGGLQFVTDSDIALCSSNARFLDPHVSFGQTVEYSAFTLARTIPFGVAMRLALTGRHEHMSAARALEIGLVTEIVDPPEKLREAVQKAGELIARNSPAALVHSKRAMWRALQMGLDDACRAGSQDIAAMWTIPTRSRDRPRSLRSASRNGNHPKRVSGDSEGLRDIGCRTARPRRLALVQPAARTQCHESHYAFRAG